MFIVLNKLGKSNEMQGLWRILSLFRIEFDSTNVIVHFSYGVKIIL